MQHVIMYFCTVMAVMVIEHNVLYQSIEGDTWSCACCYLYLGTYFETFANKTNQKYSCALMHLLLCTLSDSFMLCLFKQ